MQAKIQKIVKTVLGVALGVFIGRSLWLRQDAQARPELYAANSAPWYAPLILEGAILAAVFVIGGAVWWIAGRRDRK